MSGEEKEGRRKKEDVLIKSNNPHLAGGEKCLKLPSSWMATISKSWVAKPQIIDQHCKREWNSTNQPLATCSSGAHLSNLMRSDDLSLPPRILIWCRPDLDLLFCCHACFLTTYSLAHCLVLVPVQMKFDPKKTQRLNGDCGKPPLYCNYVLGLPRIPQVRDLSQLDMGMISVPAHTVPLGPQTWLVLATTQHLTEFVARSR